jgi:hypothetical protein
VLLKSLVSFILIYLDEVSNSNSLLTAGLTVKHTESKDVSFDRREVNLMKKRTFRLKKKRKRRDREWPDFFLDLLELAEFLILLPFRMIMYLFRAVFKALSEFFNF